MGVADWARRDPWRDRMGLTIEKHLRRACEANDIAIGALQDIVGPLAMTALDCAFEDCCGRVWEDGTSLAGDYLKRRGWKETAANRAYIEALRSSVMSLYEISEVRPGEGFLARDLVRGGEPVFVTERTASRTLVAWDVIAVRIVTARGVTQLTSVVLDVGRDLARDILGVLTRTQARAPAMAAELLGDADPALSARLGSETLDADALLRLAAPTITTMWLNDAIRRCLAPPPQLANTDGDPLEFMTLHYRLAAATTAADIAAALAGIPDIEAGEDGARWTLLAPESPAPKRRSRKGAPGSDAGRTVHASLSLGGELLKVLVNSEARAARARALLDPALAGLVRAPLVERMTPEQAMAQAARADIDTAPRLPEGLDPGALRTAIHGVLDGQYRRTLGQPVPMLGGKTPRQAARSAKGRQAVADWLKTLEQSSARLSPDDPMRDYDFGWMWRELGVADLRV